MSPEMFPERSGGHRVERLAASTVVLDMVVRSIVLVILGLGIKRATASTCGSSDFCDDPGMQDLLIAPFILYMAWNLLVILLGVSFRKQLMRAPLGLVAAGAAVRLLWLGPLTATSVREWPWLIAPLVLSIGTVVMALVAVRPAEGVPARRHLPRENAPPR